MTDPDLTPEAVEALIERLRVAYGGELSRDCAATLRALSAALEAERKKARMNSFAGEAVDRPLDEVYDTQREVEQNPCGAWQAIQALSAENARLREALKPFASAWNIAQASGNTAMSRLALIARDETAGVHFMRARAALDMDR